MKVAILCLSPGIGGLELYALREYLALTARGVDCVPIVTEGSQLAQRFAAEQIPVLSLQVSFRKLPLLAATKLASLLRHASVDIVHMHFAKDLALAALAKKRYSFGLVYTRHMDISRSKKDWMHRLLYQEIDGFWTITESMRQQAIDYLPMDSDKIQCIYLGVGAPVGDGKKVDFFSAHEFPRRQLNLALFGRMEREKGQHLLIDAMSRLIDQGMDLSATLVGHVMDADYKNQLQTTVNQQGLQQRIRFIDFMDQPIESMANFDAIVLTTFKETFGLVLPEAMRAGVAVIGSNAGGVPEIIDAGETGLLFESRDSGSLADAISTLYVDADCRRAMAGRGKEKADQLFAEDRHFDVVLEQLQQI